MTHYRGLSNGQVLFKWFNGTHQVRVVKDERTLLGVVIECCMADDEATPTSDWEPYAPSQEAWYKDFAMVLAEGYRHMGGSDDQR